jgi:hypothetical protein
MNFLAAVLRHAEATPASFREYFTISRKPSFIHFSSTE